MKRRAIYPVLFYGLVFLGCFNTPHTFSQSLSDEETMRVIRMVQSNKIAEMEELLRQETRGREEILRVKDNEGKNLLGIAAKRGYLGMASLLTAFGIDINQRDNRGKTPLLRAVEGGFEEIVRYLLRLNADPNIADAQEYFPLYVAAKHGSLVIMDELIEGGADLGQTKEGETVLHVAARHDREGVFTFLYNKQVRLNVLNRGGVTPFLTAIYQEKETVVDTLLTLGSNPNETSRDGVSALQIAAYVKNRSIMEKLIRSGADLQYRAPSTLGGGGFMDYLRTGDLTREEYLNLGLSIYESLAREGNIAAMYQAGRIYELLGQGEVNDRKAFRWFRSVLDRNARHPNANFRIGVFYEQGRGDLRKDIEAAFDYYEKARRGGHAIAAAKIHIKNRLGGIHAYRDLAHIKQEIQERYLAAKEKVEQEVEEGYRIPGFDLKVDYHNALQVLREVKSEHDREDIRVNYDFIPYDPFQSEHDVNFEAEVEDRKITAGALSAVKRTLHESLRTHPAYIPNLTDSLEYVMGAVSRCTDALKKKFIGVLEYHVRECLEEGLSEQEAMGTFALKMAQNEGRCGDGLSTYLDEEITNLLQHTTEGRSIGGRLSQVLQLYKQEFIEKHKTPFSEAYEERTEALALLRQRMRLPLGLIGKFHAPLYPAMGFGGELRYTPSHVMEVFLKGGNITFSRGVRRHTERVEELTPGFMVNLFMQDYKSDKILRNAYIQAYIESNQELKDIHENAIIMMEDHPYFNLNGPDSIHYLTPQFMERLALDHGFLIKKG